MTKQMKELISPPSAVVIGLLLLLTVAMDAKYFGTQLLIFITCILICRCSAAVASMVAALLTMSTLVIKHFL